MSSSPQLTIRPKPARKGPKSRRPLAAAIGRRVFLYGGILSLLLLVGWNTGCMERLFYYPVRGETPPPAVEFRGAELVEFASEDGTKLVGWFIPAQLPGRPVDSASAATVLHVHGNAGNMTSHLYFTEYLPRAGFNVFLFDYRGYGESEGRAHKRNDLIADTNAALDALLALPIDPGRVAMYGQSLGGAIGLNVMAKRPEIRAAVLESPFSSWRDAAASALGGGEPGLFSRTLVAMLIPDHARPIDALRTITDRPILLLHGTADSIVPVQHSQRLAAASENNVRFLELEGGEHNQLRESHPELESLVIRYLQEHLVAPPQ